MSSAFMPSVRRRLTADDPFAPSVESEEIFSANPGGVFSPNVQAAPPDEAGHYESNRSRSNFHYATPNDTYKPSLTGGSGEAGAESSAVATADPYSARLSDVGSRLESAYSAKRPGTARQIFGALLSRHHPELAGIVSGETQRQRQIEPLQQEYGLVSDIISKNRAAQTADITNRLHQAQTEFYGPKTQALLNPPPKQTPQEQALADYMGRINPATKKNYTPAEALKQVNQDAEDVKPEKTPPTAGLTYDEGIPVTFKDETGKAWDVNDPNLPPAGKAMVATANKAHGQHVKESADAQARAAAAANQRQSNTFSRQDVKEHDKAYVQPAEGVEKSYQMMNNAYNEYRRAKAQGKELPTGAQSMLALSTHLATTFGNVKGSRVTKDMIQEHLGARSIPDSALVAIQKLTNGDVLSPDQWEAFHSLIGESRKLSWQTAVKQAKRKDIPTDFLPPDLQGLSGEGASATGGFKPF